MIASLYIPTEEFASATDLCSSAKTDEIEKKNSMDVYNRPQCLDPGNYYQDPNGARHTDASGFYSYEAKGVFWQ